jgi:carboxyl-terminal processing protease
LLATPSKLCRPGFRLAVLGIFLLGGAVGLVQPSRAGPGPRELKALRVQAEQFERLADWEHACQAYDLLLRLDRTQPGIRGRLLHCLRRYWQASRQKDSSYRKEVLTLGYPQALKIYRYVLTSLLESSVDRKALTPMRVVRKGLEEYRYALADPVFLQYNLPTASPAEVAAFRDYLHEVVGPKVRAVRTPQQAVNLVREAAIESLSRFHLNPTTVVMEFTCGACYASDDYTSYLTPAQLRELCEGLKGEPVGVGLKLASLDGKLVIDQVLPDSPAAEQHDPALAPGQIVAAIDGRPVGDLLPETAMVLLQGEADTLVQIEILSPMGPIHVRLRRRPVFVPSVGAALLKRPYIGYVQISCFQETTPQEVDAALQTLLKLEARALVLDLRGNGGGRFEAAIATARRFLASGIITSTQYPDPQQNVIYRARGPAVWTLPLVVLIDGDTASAAEVLAGALKENKRAILVGQPTFGKGCIQQILKLSPRPGVVYPGGIRLTVARFCSPGGQPYNGRGIVPDLIVERSILAESQEPIDEQLEAGLNRAQELLSPPKS